MRKMSMGKEKPTTKICKHCKAEIPFGAKVCPNCRKSQKGKGCLITVLAFIAIGIISSAMGKSSGDKTSPQTEAAIKTIATDNANGNTEPTSVEVSSENTSIPSEYKSALKKAKTYGDVMHMSKGGIYNQLISEYGEKFSIEAAQYAVDNSEIDYNKNALNKAETYSQTMSMSKKGIYDQLVSENGEKFTPEEAQYAIDHIEADWNENALKKAKTYQGSMSMSPAAIHDQLTSDYGEKFSQEEADYAIANLN